MAAMFAGISRKDWAVAKTMEAAMCGFAWSVVHCLPPYGLDVVS
jgi:hypothetical protein